MMLGVPAGLTLYIFMNNLLSILQQQYVNRVIAKGETAPA
jgi:membrane protein insertase Oxa1/YidC/SpoIIIJ